MKVCDFLGQPLAAGDFVTYPGTGNRGAEYGMILHRIDAPIPWYSGGLE